MDIGPMELVVILLIVLVLFGSKRLPELARSLGQSLREFKRGIREADRESGETPSRDDKHAAAPDSRG